MTFEVSAPPLREPEPKKDHQMVNLILPSKEVLQEIGRTLVLFGQLEHLLKLVHKRTTKNMPLHAVLQLKVTLGGLLTGAKEWGDAMRFDGLIKMAEENPQLASIINQLKKANTLVSTRNRYAHNGIGRKSNGKFVFLNSGIELEESQIIRELDDASQVIERLLPEINSKIPPPSP